MSRLTEVLKEYDELGIRAQIDYDRLYLYSVITHSTAVEGSTVTEIENRLMFDDGITPSKPLTEQLMNLDLKKAYEEAFRLAKSRVDYSVELLCRLAGLVMRNTGTEYKTLLGTFNSANGDLRLLNVTAGQGGKSYLAFQKVPRRLADFCEWINVRRKEIAEEDIDKIYELSYAAHYNLVTIHPWADGNGRISRLVMNMIQTEFGVVPSIVKKEKREEYIKSLADAQDDGEINPFLDFMIRNHIHNLESEIAEYLKSIDHDTLNLKNDTLNDTLKNESIDVNSKEKNVLELLKKDNKMSIADITEKTGYSRPTVNRVLDALKKKGLLSRSGAKKNGHWVV